MKNQEFLLVVYAFYAVDLLAALINHGKTREVNFWTTLTATAISVPIVWMVWRFM